MTKHLCFAVGLLQTALQSGTPGDFMKTNMKCRSLIILILWLIRTTLGDDSYHESLLIKPLGDGRVFAHFDLRTTTENIHVAGDDSTGKILFTEFVLLD